VCDSRPRNIRIWSRELILVIDWDNMLNYYDSAKRSRPMDQVRSRRKITEAELDAAQSLHLAAFHRGNSTTKVKVKPAAEEHFIKLAQEKLTPEQVYRLEIAHLTLGLHWIDPE